MNENTLVAVSAYSGDANQITNNLPILLHHRCPVWILSPEDKPIQSMPGCECKHAGLSGWIGDQTLVRHVEFLKILLASRFEYFLFNDADSACLTAMIPRYLYESDASWSNEVTDTNPGPSRLPKIAMQPPYFFSRRVLTGLLRASEPGNLPPSYVCPTPHGDMPVPTQCIDHYHLQLSCGSGFPHRNFPDGRSWETASGNGLACMMDEVQNKGAVLIHQIKTKPVMEALVSARARYLLNSQRQPRRIVS